MNLSLTTLIELPEVAVETIKANHPDVASLIIQHYDTQFQETTKAIAKLNPDDESFVSKYRFLQQLNQAHKQALNIWSK